MANPPLSDKDCLAVVDAWLAAGRNKAQAAAQMKMDRNTYRHRFDVAKKRGFLENKSAQWSSDPLPSDDLSVDEIKERRRKEFSRKKEAKDARKEIPIKVHMDGPFGILFFGDPHLDDPGSNFPLVEEHTDLVAGEDGLFGWIIGDVTNNWVGRLVRLYAEQETTARQAWMLTEWWLEALGPSLMAIVLGNHDLWAQSDNTGVHPIEFINGRKHTFHAEPYQVRCALHTPNGQKFIVHSRHDFPGHSMWNPAHGPARAAQMGWEMDDVLICGHLHAGAYMKSVSPFGNVSHAIRLASYKSDLDTYADAKGLPRKNLWESAVIIFDPDAQDPRERVLVFGVDQGVRILRLLRADWKRGKGKAA